VAAAATGAPAAMHKFEQRDRAAAESIAWRDACVRATALPTHARGACACLCCCLQAKATAGSNGGWRAARGTQATARTSDTSGTQARAWRLGSVRA
jgi:hypothetical protein